VKTLTDKPVELVGRHITRCFAGTLLLAVAMRMKLTDRQDLLEKV
jgi:hypothetical protein